MLRRYVVRWLAKLLFSDNPVIEGLPVRDVILGSSNCSTIEEYQTMMRAPSMDSRSWGGWAEIVLLAAKWNVEFSMFWRKSHSEAFLFARTRGAKPHVRPAVLFHPRGQHYDMLRLSAPAWAAVDAQMDAH